MARSGGNRVPLAAGFRKLGHFPGAKRGCDAIAHLKFTGVDATVAIPHALSPNPRQVAGADGGVSLVPCSLAGTQCVRCNDGIG